MAIPQFPTSVSADKPPTVGVLMLETQFPRILGDIGNADSWPFPVRYKNVPNSTANHVIRHNAADLTPLFIDAAQQLVSEGIAAITTSCGFLSLVQQDLADAVNVPVITSSLMQVPWINATLPTDKRTGVMTIDEANLSVNHLNAANAPADTPIASPATNGVFVSTIMNDYTSLDVEACRSENLEAAKRLVEASNDLGAIVLECTNMVPYAADIHRATRLPVYSIHTLVRWLYSGLQPTRF